VSAGTIDGERFAREVSALLPNLYATALRLSRDSADAEDLVAEAIAKAWAAIEGLQDADRFRGWIFRILTNTYLARCRAEKVRPRGEAWPDENEDDFSLFEKLHQPFLLWWSNPERQFLDRLLREDLERAVDALPDPFRSVVVLVDLQGLSYADVAEALHVPLGTVRSRLARGRGLLQRALWLHAHDAGLVTAARAPGPKREAESSRGP
jgi:RNA polymerase sigma-70 factor, ECF subfamily